MIVGLDGSARLMCCSTRCARRRVDSRQRYGATNPSHDAMDRQVALNADLRRASAADAQGAELRALPVTLMSAARCVRRLGRGIAADGGRMLAIGISLGLASVVAHAWSLSILLQNVVTMIGLGLGIDYSLLFVGRFRDELRAGRERQQAAVEALRRAGPTIALSGLRGGDRIRRARHGAGERAAVGRRRRIARDRRLDARCRRRCFREFSRPSARASTRAA